MEKYLRVVFFVAFVLSSLGFRECQTWESFLLVAFRNHAVGSSTELALNATSGDDIYAIAVGDNGIIYTSTGRQSANWVESQSGTTQNLNFVRANPDAELVSCAVGNAGTVLLSHDKGITWSDQSIPALSENLYSFDFIYTNDDFINIVVCGEAGNMYRSSNSNGVYTWQQITTNTTERLNTIGAIASELYIVAGENGIIIKTYDGGLTWDNVGVSDPDADFNRMFLGILVKSYEHGWIAADNGKIYMTTDYGNTWLSRESGTSENLFDITFKNSLEGVVAGANGVVRYTSDGGFTWQEDTYLSGLTTRDIVSISGVDENTASAITVNNFNGDSQGADTTFFLAVSSEPFTDVEDDENLILSEYSLEQNYPNPFNPTTRIQYQVSSISQVTLKVYDVLGNEIAVLVNEEKDRGVYSVSFDAAQLVSGIYFYELQTSSFIETKKMILLR